MTCSGEVAELQPTEYLSLTPPIPSVKDNLQAVKCRKTRKAHSRAIVLVCPFWATVETWRRNMADSVEEDPLPM